MVFIGKERDEVLRNAVEEAERIGKARAKVMNDYGPNSYRTIPIDGVMYDVVETAGVRIYTPVDSTRQLTEFEFLKGLSNAALDDIFNIGVKSSAGTPDGEIVRHITERQAARNN